MSAERRLYDDITYDIIQWKKIQDQLGLKVTRDETIQIFDLRNNKGERKLPFRYNIHFLVDFHCNCTNRHYGPGIDTTASESSHQ